tara:strand:- start:4378 stop:4950 length:573 start_codon:yes stop_codon:yes gene_type:complete
MEKLNFKILNSQVTKEELINLANLHKQILEDSMASTLKDDLLSQLYYFLIKNNLLYVVVVKNENNDIIGSISCTSGSLITKVFRLDFIKILKIILTGILSKPTLWIKHTYFKLVTYFGVNSNANIVFLFVDKKYQNQNIGNKLLSFIIQKFKTNITLDTNSNNQNAIEFYKKNNFEILRKNKKNVLMKYK